MSAGEEKQTALVTVESSALTKAGAKSLVARGRSDLQIHEDAEECLKRGLDLWKQGNDETQVSFESTQLALDKQMATGKLFSSEEKLAFFDRHFLRDPNRRREAAFVCFERGIKLSPSHPGLQHSLGGAYYNGWGVPQDPVKAATWFRKAAKQGHAEAQFDLGAIYAYTDNVQAASWWRKAAEQGHADSQRRLGDLYVCGVGVERDYAQAAFWIRKVAEQAEDSEMSLSDIYSQLTSWLRVAAEQGVVDAQYLLGWLYHHGRHVPQDHEQAARWYRMAAEQGDADAQLALDAM